MIFLKLLLSGALIYIAAMPISKSTDTNLETVQRHDLKYKLSDHIQPLNYKMELILGDIFVIANSTITIYILRTTQYISFHAPSLIKLMKQELKLIKRGEIYKINSIFHHNNTVMLDFVDTLVPDIYTLHIDFEIEFFELISISWPIISLTFQDVDIRWLMGIGIQQSREQIFPFWNKPELKTTFDISVMHNRRYKALSHMPIQGSKPAFLRNKYGEYNDMVWTYFQNTSLMSIDNVALIVSDLNQTTNVAETISIWCREKLISYVQFALLTIENITMYLDNYWNNAKRVREWIRLSPEWKVDHVAIPGFQGEVKETLGLVFYKEADIIYNEELDAIAHKMMIARLITREMAKKYIGNLLNPSYSSHLWLNEGFTMFLQTYIMDKALSDCRMMDLFVVQIQHEILDLNACFFIKSTLKYNINVENYLLSSLSIIKGSIIWRMLERTMPTDVFLKGINKYLNNQYSYPKATASDDLWAAMQAAISTSDLKYQFDVKGVMGSWATQSYFPVLEVKRNYSSDVVTISVQFDHKLDKKEYYIPLTYTTESNPNFDKTWPDVWLTQWYSKTEFSLEKDQWIIVNLQQAGYYRVNYDTENWERIARYLNSPKFNNIHLLNRAQIIDDAFHFAIEKKLDFSVFWKLAKYLSSTTYYVAWYPMFKALEFISNVIPFMKIYPEFKEVQESLKFVKLNTIGQDMMDTKDNHECLKEELFKWSCIVDDSLCKLISNYQLEWYLEDTKKYKLSPGWKKWTYCYGLKEANTVIWNKLLRLYQKNFDRTILECLTSSEASEIIIDYLEKTLPKIISIHISKLHNLRSEKLEQARERVYALNANIFLSALARNTGHMLKDILKNFKKIKPGRVSDRAALTVIINNMYSKEQLDEINKFLKEEMKNLISEFESKIETRLSEIERQIEYLRSLFSQLEN